MGRKIWGSKNIKMIFQVCVKCGKKQSRVVKIRVGGVDLGQESGLQKIQEILKLGKNGEKSEQIILFLETQKMAVNGEANKDILSILSKFFKISKSQIIFKNGRKSKIKLIQIIY